MKETLTINVKSRPFDDDVEDVTPGKHPLNEKPELNGQKVPTFRKSEVVLGRLLGSGAYAEVRQLKRTHSNSPHHHDTVVDHFVVEEDEDDSEARDDQPVQRRQDESEPFVSERLPLSNGGFAVKFLKSPNPSKRVQKDLAIEISVLQSLRHRHQNIINIQGTDAYADKPPSFFVMDRLVGTLSDRIKHDWSERSILALANGTIPGLRFLSIDTTVDLEADLLAERLQVACQLASALKFLHDQRIVFRDLKPDNVGFDDNGVVKLFDFGFAKRLDDGLQSSKEAGLYRLTGRTGTFPYMAPEVDNLHPYNEKCDVFSFSILLWEVLALDFCFSSIYTHAEFHQRVSQAGERPPLPQSWPTLTRQIMRDAWSPSPSDRPTFVEIRTMIRSDLKHLTNIQSPKSQRA